MSIKYGGRASQGRIWGKRNRGSKPNKAEAGSGAIVRHALQQLETAGYVTKMKGRGRILSPKGVNSSITLPLK